jgi:hypothetical protein
VTSKSTIITDGVGSMIQCSEPMSKGDKRWERGTAEESRRCSGSDGWIYERAGPHLERRRSVEEERAFVWSLCDKVRCLCSTVQGSLQLTVQPAASEGEEERWRTCQQGRNPRNPKGRSAWRQREANGYAQCASAEAGAPPALLPGASSQSDMAI